MKFILPAERICLDEFERGIIAPAPERAGDDQTQAAGFPDLSWDSLRYRIKKFDLIQGGCGNSPYLDLAPGRRSAQVFTEAIESGSRPRHGLPI